MAVSMTKDNSKPHMPKPHIPEGLDRWTRLVFSVLKHLSYGTLTIVLPDGRPVVFEGREPGPKATVEVYDYAAFKQFVLSGDVGFSETYMDGMTDSPDMTALVELFARNKDDTGYNTLTRPLTRMVRRFLHWLNSNTKTGSRRNIAHHYDLGNAFYEKWLDPSMTYSSAVFSGSQQDLESAQAEKYRRIAERLDIKSGSKVLEIGCGWGGFASYAAREYGAHVVGLTLSREQHDFAVERMKRENVADRVEIRMQDYRDVAGEFDAIASIEMFEAVGERYWPTFFQTVRDRLRPGGKAGLQIITIHEEGFEEYKGSPDFIQKYIFPGGMLPTRTHIRDLTEKAGMSLTADDGFGRDYARTLAEWRVRFLDAWPEIAAIGFDERFKRMWFYYLAYCEGAFLSENIDVRQVSLARP